MTIEEPTIPVAKEILHGLKEYFETFHGGIIDDTAIEAAVDLSVRYQTDKRLPDKAIDLVDEAASKLRLQQDSKPEEIWKLERMIATKRIEIEALRKEKSVSAQERQRKASEQQAGHRREAGRRMDGMCPS